jgi:hypothetical protein
MSSSHRRAFTGRSRELLLVKNAREASREKATLKQHCNDLEEQIRALESTSASESCEKMEQLKLEVLRLKADLTESKRTAYDVSRKAAAAAADSVSKEAHGRACAELQEARAELDVARAAAAAAKRRHEDAATQLTAKLGRERDVAVSTAVRAAKRESEVKAAENDEWLQKALLERTAAASLLEREKQSLGAKVTELERVVAEGEACLRDMDHERDEQRRKYKRAAAAESAGRLAAEATAAALTGEVARLHGTLERFGGGLRAHYEPAAETVDCTTSPMPAAMMAGAAGEVSDDDYDVDDSRSGFNDDDDDDDLGDATMEYGSMTDCCETTPGPTTLEDDAAAAIAAALTSRIEHACPTTPLSMASLPQATRVKAAARAIEAAAGKAMTTPGDMSMDDSAMGGAGNWSAGPASVGSKPVSKAAAAADMSPAAFSFEYTPLSKPSAAAAARAAGAAAAGTAAVAPAFGGAEIPTGRVSVPYFAGDVASAADVDLFATLMTLVRCMCVLSVAATRRSAAAGARLAAVLLVTALVVVGVAAVAEVALQLAGDPPTLAVPIRMGGMPPKELLRRVSAR